MKREKVTADDCLFCGLCCVSLHDQDAFANVDEADCDKLGVRWVRCNVLFPSWVDATARAMDGQGVFGAIKTKWLTQRSGPLKGCEVCACVALQGSVMKKVSCRIYDRRPKVCREAVVPNDRTCRTLRRECELVTMVNEELAS